MAKEIGVTTRTINLWCRELNVPASVTATPRDAAVSLAGEDWRDRPDLGVRVSSAGRVASLRTGLLVKATTPTHGRGEPYVTTLGANGRGPRRTTVVSRLVAETFSLKWTPRPSGHNVWTRAEMDKMRRCRTLEQAVRALPNRSESAIRDQARKRKVEFLTPSRLCDGPARGSVPFLHPLWAEAHALIPHGWAEDVRFDLISDVVVMVLSGEASDLGTALKMAKRNRNRMMGKYRERSLDEPIPGLNGLRLIDRVDSLMEHF